MQIDVANRAVLITGCSSGFGKGLALALHQQGFVVFAGFHSAKGDTAEQFKLLGQSTGRLHVLQLDVTDQAQIDQAVEYVKENSPAKGLWALVNNSGIAVLGYAEWIPLTVYEKVISVNMWGTIRMTMAFLPLLRKEKEGRIVNVTSGGGRVGLLYHAPYVASKFAVEGLSDVMRMELSSMGIKVCVVEPGNYIRGTQIFRNQVKNEIMELWDNLDDSTRASYTERRLELCWGMALSFVSSGVGSLNLKLVNRTINLFFFCLVPWHRRCCERHGWHGNACLSTWTLRRWQSFYAWHGIDVPALSRIFYGLHFPNSSALDGPKLLKCFHLKGFEFYVKKCFDFSWTCFSLRNLRIIFQLFDIF